MAGLYCFSCGTPTTPKGDRPVPFCSICRVAGPQVVPDRVRWMVRGSDGKVRGPLSRQATIDQMVRGTFGPFDGVSRVGGRWHTTCEHPDFRHVYLPGSSQAEKIVDEQRTRRREDVVHALRKNVKLGAAALFLLGAAGFVAYQAVGGGVALLSEESANDLIGTYEQIRASIDSQVTAALDEDAARVAAAERADLPSEELIAELKKRHGAVKGATGAMLVTGRAALWQETRRGLNEAVYNLERAVALDDDDVEALASLGEAYARLAVYDPALLVPMAQISERAAAIESDAAATLRARAWGAHVSGSEALATDLASRCGDPAAAALVPGSGVDVGCALLLAQIKGDVAGLRLVQERLPGVPAVELALGRALLERDRYGEALAVGKTLARLHPDVLDAHELVALAARQTGDWGDAQASAAVLAAAEPERLMPRIISAEIELKVQGNGAEALAEYGDVVIHPLFDRVPNRQQVLADAAAAALAAGNSGRAVDLADQALAIEGGHPAATLQKARALAARNNANDAEEVLRGVDLNQLQGAPGARFHVGAAQVYMALGRERAAVTELDAALDADARWPLAHLESARARLSVDNVAGALERVEALAELDTFHEAALSPLQPIWFPTSSWGQFRRELGIRVDGDVRLQPRGPTAQALVAWATGAPEASRLLASVVTSEPDNTRAHAALAQHYLRTGQDRAVLGHVDKVLAGDPTDALMHSVRGRASARLGQYSAAEDSFSRAMGEGSDRPTLHRWRGEALALSGATAEARDAYLLALRLAPDDLLSRQGLVALGPADH